MFVRRVHLAGGGRVRGVGHLLSWGLDINNPWSRGMPYILGILGSEWYEISRYLFINKTAVASGGTPRHPSY